ncbi:hypothetical protein QOT17_015667, partial [Balamuthia mandrillaris]
FLFRFLFLCCNQLCPLLHYNDLGRLLRVAAFMGALQQPSPLFKAHSLGQKQSMPTRYSYYRSFSFFIHFFSLFYSILFFSSFSPLCHSLHHSLRHSLLFSGPLILLALG